MSPTISRRRFLQATAALSAGAVLADLPGVGDLAAHARPLGPADGVLVLVNLAGGNDARNTLVPLADPRYAELRGPLALPAERVLPLSADAGLHPSLRFLKRRWDAGQLAIVEGVGDPDPDLSHFVSMARWMSGSRTVHTTGWLGRYLDGLGGDALDAVNIGTDVPLTVIGATRQASGIGSAAPAFGASTETSGAILAASLQALAAAPSPRGPLADAVTAAGATMVDVNRATAPLYTPTLVDPQPAHDLELAARLINAGLGPRVVSITCGGYDTHASQLGWHARLLAGLDAGLARFFTVLSPAYAGRVCVLIVSEFGRAPRANASGGTDHGTAGLHLVVGARVRGGRHGATPSLSDLTRLGRERVTVEQRAVFATVLSRWMAADDHEVLGATYAPLDLFVGPPDATPVEGMGAAGDLPRAGRIVAVTPARLLDTRVGAGAAPVRAGEPVELTVTGVGGVPLTGVSSVVLNVTATEPTSAGYVTVWPTGVARPLASNLNVIRGATVPNLVVAAVGDAGRVSILSSAVSAHLVVDVVAFGGDVGGGTLVPITPTRLVDTRTTNEPLAPGAPLIVPVAGRGGIPAVGVVGVVANVTVVEPAGPGYLTAWPAGEPAPLASNLNFVAGQTVPNLVLVKLRDGAMALQASVGTHVVVDVGGYLVADATGAELRTSVPVRVLDTREPGGTGAPLGPAATLGVATASVVPPEATAVLLNVTAVEPTAAGFVTAWSGDVDLPLASTLNVVPGQVVANLAVVPLDASGRCALYNSAGHTHLVVDVMGWFS